MPWFNVDDDFHSNRKTTAVLAAGTAGREALGLWVVAGAWCMAELTDGFVPSYRVTQLGWRPKHADLLVREKLWVKVDGGYRFHEWLDRNPSKEAVTAVRGKTLQRVRGFRERQRNAVTNAGRNAAVTACVTALPIPSSDQLSSGVVDLNPDPTRARLTMQPPPTLAGVIGGAVANEADIHAVYRAWHAAIQRSGHTAVHAFDAWRSHFATIAIGCGLDAGGDSDDAAVARAAVCLWFWCSPTGPVKSGRLRIGYASPLVLAKRITPDLESAKEWWLSLNAKEQQDWLASIRVLGEAAQ